MTVPEAVQAGLWGLLAGAALILGAAIAWFIHVPQRLITVLGFLAAFVLSKLGG